MADQPYLSAFFEPIRMVRLEYTKASALATITKVLFRDGVFYVLDQDQPGVFTFDAQGRFLGIIGALGEGPGEYRATSNITWVFDNNLAVTDTYSGRIHIYDPQGTWICSTPSPGSRTGWLAPENNIIWPEPSTLYLSGIVQDPSQPAPAHAKVHVKHERLDSGLIKIFGYDLEKSVGFGSINPFVWERTGTPAMTPVFSKVGNTIWAAELYFVDISIAAMDGSSISRVNPGCVHQLTDDLLDDLRGDGQAYQRELMKTLGGKCWTVNLFTVGKLVFIEHGNQGYLVFDQAGHQLSKKHFRSDIGALVGSNGDMAISTFLYSGVAPQAGPHYQKELDLLSSTTDFPVGDPAAEDENPVLRISKLVKLVD